MFEHDAPYLEKSGGANNLIANKYFDLLYAKNPKYTEQFLVEKCWKHYNLSIKGDSSVFSAFNNAGVIAFRYFQKPDLALGYFKRGISMQPDFPQAYENIGDCYYQMKNTDEAIVNYKKAIQQNPRQFNATIRLATAYMDYKNYRDALRILVRADTIFRGSYEVAEKTGTCYYLDNQKEKGIAKLEEAYSLQPDKNLAKVLAELCAKEGLKQKSEFYASRSAGN